MVFEYILRQNGIDPAKDLEINQNIDFGSTAAAFSEDDSDFTVEFEPHATSLETGGKGHVVASLGLTADMFHTLRSVPNKAISKRIRRPFKNLQMPFKKE